MAEAVPQASIDINYVAELVPVRLTRENYLIWKSTFIPVLKTYSLFNIIQGTEQCPSKDNICRILISKTLSEATLPYITKCEGSSARDLWLYLEKEIGEAAKSKVRWLRTRMQTLKYGLTSCPSDYFESAEQIADKLAVAGCPVSNSELVAYIFDGLPWVYKVFVTWTRKWKDVDHMSLEELHDLLVRDEYEYAVEGAVGVACLWLIIRLCRSKGK
ncbi:uncharacterized protein LOC121051397 [Rosa chinensis]|uniref:uncharacterized protein LOC121051397 n=1 Tax=Rosa chinensis TaxID=74649 RepID=UPI001AD8C2BA|nr:uncharacterized protein LOC121051397 [Rosa chinensis]XP_040369633.1 uncharacterized protein LOC121051397 [Rosa chinensis]